MLNIEQIKERVQELSDQEDAFQEVYRPVLHLWDGEIPSEELGPYDVDRTVEALDRAEERLSILRDSVYGLRNALKIVQHEGIAPAVEFPEAARHLWSTMSICRELYCERTGLPRSATGAHIAAAQPSALNPLFRAVDDGLRLYNDYILKRLDSPAFERLWREKVINVAVEMAAVPDTAIPDPLAYMAAALPEELARSDRALKST